MVVMLNITNDHLRSVEGLIFVVRSRIKPNFFHILVL